MPKMMEMANPVPAQGFLWSSSINGSHYSLDWTTGLTQNGVNAFPAIFSVGEKLIMFIQPTSLFAP